ncbi:unnamed protein product [Eruca vesicaria subsp. sativa]|uniref:KIB1-4 beta-propeller domain-containing protein n=1 Tax=Eruca vesicaria subsp. sativa TaxID=29727 RepID=A0ABC8JX83_ERUVS|nr:unnamed protein product [Eruca vesicaria subsp. sativa]
MSQLTLRVCRLDVDAGQWVVVSDIGDRVLVIGDLGNVSFSAEELPDGCGVSVNSIFFTYGPSNVTCSYKYEEEHNCWRYSRKDCVTILSRSPVEAFRVERSSADASHCSWPQAGRSVHFTFDMMKDKRLGLISLA